MITVARSTSINTVTHTIIPMTMSTVIRILTMEGKTITDTTIPGTMALMTTTTPMINLIGDLLH
jgi:hypothetical protein